MVRVYSREFRAQVVRRILDGETVKALSQEVGVHRKLLYQWLRKVNEGGEENLRDRGRPRKQQGARAAGEPEQNGALERTISQQGMVIDFLRGVVAQLRQRTHPKDAWRECAYGVVEERVRMRTGLSVEKMCELTGLSRCGYYRYLRTRSQQRQNPSHDGE